MKFYQLFISPALPKSCRFYPSCSEYCLTAIKKLPLHKAIWLSIKRLACCQPFHPGGYDPVIVPTRNSVSKSK